MDLAKEAVLQSNPENTDNISEASIALPLTETYVYACTYIHIYIYIYTFIYIIYVCIMRPVLQPELDHINKRSESSM